MRLVISLLALLLSGNAWSTDTANVIEHCERDEGRGDLYCVGYYSATVNATVRTTEVFKEAGSFDLFCPPDNFTMGIGIRIWQRYVEENPEMLTEQPYYSIILSLQDAYPIPCDS